MSFVRGPLSNLAYDKIYGRTNIDYSKYFRELTKDVIIVYVFSDKKSLDRRIKETKETKFDNHFHEYVF